MQGQHDKGNATRERLRGLPAVGVVLERPAVRALAERHGRSALLRAVREVLAAARSAILQGETPDVSDVAVAQQVARGRSTSLRPVINAAGIVVHTNLGRAPLAAEAIEAVAEVARGYSSLEYDLEEGARGSRHDHAVPLLRELTGAEAALVVNNNAAAVLLALSALAAGREVIVSRGELVEIGGGFRVPDVMTQSGARLVEVGTTNRTRAADFEAALGEDTALCMKVHRSNFAVVGFTAEASLEELAAVSRPRGVPVLYDAGSGCLLRQARGDDEITVREALERGADVVTFSGDKLLGGPQAGVLVGRRDLIERARRHPLMRAVRPDKMAIAALVATLQLWRDAPERIPVVKMLRGDVELLAQRAHALVAALRRALPDLDVEVTTSAARVGGGASPLIELESRAVSVRFSDLDGVAQRLREHTPAVVARIEGGALILDLAAVHDDEDKELAAALLAALGGQGA